MAMNADTRQFSKIVLFGVGLIGGSFALALKQRVAATQIVGVERNPVALARAVELGIIDSASNDLAAALTGADLIVVAAPVAQTGAILASIYPHLQPHTVVTDTGSTKSDVVVAARVALKEKIAQFVPAHPIAGRESNGPDAAIADLYHGKKLVITALPENTPDTVDTVALAWRYCGAQPHYLTPEQHDQVFAAVSHLPHLLAYALVDQIAVQPQADLRFQYAASGFRDFTRIAGSSPEMWRDICLANRSVLQRELHQYQVQLQTLATALETSDGARLLDIFTNAQTARQRWINSIESAEKPPREGGD